MSNGTMIQFFHWYTPADGNFWKEVKNQAKYLSGLGITAVWLPPACKTSGGGLSVGYNIYDLYDLGEFDQKGSIRTKYGTRPEYEEAIAAIHNYGMQAIVDVVLNHKAGGDEVEKMMVLKVDPENRNNIVSEPFEIEAYTRFTFPGRGKKYSDFEWDHTCFSGVDHAVGIEGNNIYSIQNEHDSMWEEVVDNEKGNYDYLMFNDIEFRNPKVREELGKWSEWYFDQVKFDGVRLDAVKHISHNFYNEWLPKLREKTGQEIFAVGEYWAPGHLDLLIKYIEATKGNMSLFDASLHHKFHNASKAGNDYDMRTILDDTLTKAMPDKSVTVVDNHDTQPLQALEAPVEPWFKPIAYALILLRQEGYPCVFYPDLYGATYKDHGRDGNEYEIILPKTEGIEQLLKARRNLAYGTQRDYFDHGNCIGWTREGDDEHRGCAVVISNGDGGFKNMEIGKRYAGKTFVDLLEKCPEKIVINEEGFADFLVSAGSVSVWAEENK